MSDQNLQMDTILKGLASDDADVNLAAAKACVGLELPFAANMAIDWQHVLASLYSENGPDVPSEAILMALETGPREVLPNIAEACTKFLVSSEVLTKIVEQAVFPRDNKPLRAFVESIYRVFWPLSYQWLEDDNFNHFFAIYCACSNEGMDEQWLKEGLFHGHNVEIFDICKAHIGDDLLKKWWAENIRFNGSDHDKVAILKCATGRSEMIDFILGVLEKEDFSPAVREAAALACISIGLSVNQICELYGSRSRTKVLAAVCASIGNEEVPKGLFTSFLETYGCSMIKNYAEIAYRSMPWSEPIVDLKLNPDNLVYKKCLDNVIVGATIPSDADIRIDNYYADGSRLRTNKAAIREVIGGFRGEKVGISFYDYKTAYREGDEVFIPDFYMGQGDNLPGYHFFRTMEEAIKYSP